MGFQHKVVLLLLSLALGFGVLVSCRWSTAIEPYVELNIYNHTGSAETGDPSSTVCTKGLQVNVYNFHNQGGPQNTVQPGKHILMVVPKSLDDNNPHYRIEAYCLTDSGTGKSVREVQGERLRFEIRPPNYRSGPNPDEVDPPGPWIIEKGPLD